MERLVLQANAKINLTLDVVGKRENGYHDVEMIMQSIELFDLITLQSIEGDEIRLKCSTEKLPDDSKNIAYRAAQKIKEYANIKTGVEIELEKMIPMAAGLAGGSADAAAVLVGLNRLWELQIPEAKLLEIGASLGADVPFCIKGGTMLAQGIGEILSPLPNANDIWVVLAKPPIDVPTPTVYKNLKLENITKHPSTNSVIEALYRRDFAYICSNIANVLETVTLKLYPEVEQVKGYFRESGAGMPLMSGSGPTVFALFEDRQEAEAVFSQLKEKISDTFLVKTTSSGIL